MPGTVEGGTKAATTNKEKYGSDFYRIIGAKGGKVKSSRKGFGGMSPEKRSEAGRLGGQRSRRGPSAEGKN